MKKIRYVFEYLMTTTLLGIFKQLKPETASSIGGFIGRHIGSKLSVSRKAKRHISKAFPEFSETELKSTILSMWDNLGRNFAEYPHLETIGRDYTELVGSEILDELIKNNSPAILISAHLANWEIAAPCFLTQKKFKMDLIYRAPNNPWVDTILENYRSLFGKLNTHPKSSIGMRGVINTLNQNGHVGILIDQKFNKGIEADFFGHPAMTSPVFIQLAQKYKCPLIPAQIERIGSACKFRVTLNEPIKTDNRETIDILNEAHQFLECAIRQNPAQWIWLHRRWKEK
jgi:KDO2-lipid IV(A) lauroyltransferase